MVVMGKERINERPVEDGSLTLHNEPAALDIASVHGAQLPVIYIKDDRNGAPYEYYPISDHIVAAPRVCGGRATFKYTRIDVRHVLPHLKAGLSFEQINLKFGESLSEDALREALSLASQNGPDVFQRPLVPMDAPIDHP